MNKFGLIIVTSAMALLWLGCSPSPDQLKKTIEDNPEIVFNAIEKNPKKFFEAVQSAQGEARKKARDDAEKGEKEQLEEDFKTPKTPVISDKRVIRGNKSAPVTIVEYSDFQCPYCSRAATTVKKLFDKYGDKVRLVYKHLPFKPMAEPAARYYEAIGMQSPDKAHKFHDLVYENQQKLRGDGEAFLKSTTKKVGANLAKVLKDMKSSHVDEIIKSDMAEARKYDFSGTPGFLVNGVSIKGAYPIDHFVMIIDRHLGTTKK